MTVPRLILGTRGSALALWQARNVAEQLLSRHGDLQIEQRIIKSEGDLRTESSISALGDTGVFVRRLEEALSNDEIDLAVHSLKDLPTEQPEGLLIAAVPERHDARDALLSVEGWSLEALPRGTVVGTGSPRRRSQLLHVRPDLQIVPVRGNVDTRVRLLLEHKIGALVLALAGVERLGVDSVAIRPLETTVCVPAAGQGAIAVETREADPETRGRVETLSHMPTVARITAERSCLRRLGGGCLAPATAHAQIADGRLHVEAVVAETHGRAVLMERENGAVSDAAYIGARLAERLLVAGGEKILQDARRAAEQDGGDG